MPRQAASSKGLRGSIVVVRREAGDAPVDVRGVMPWEVWKDARLDAKVGGHHGMLILALYELQEVIEDAAGEGSRGRFGKIIHFRPLKLALALGALGAAGVELSEDLRPGAHHGVALLAGVLVVKTCVSIWEARE